MAIDLDLYCVFCGEDKEKSIDGRCPDCSRTLIGRSPKPAIHGLSDSTNHRKPTIGEALAALIGDLTHELEEQEKLRLRAGDAVSTGKAVLVHLQRAAEMATGKKPERDSHRGNPPGPTSCTECGAKISGYGASGMCRSCSTRANLAARRSG
jgi:hypothetical protein